MDDEVRKSYYFFFSSRRRHTRCLSDWSSDVCSSDLLPNTPCPWSLHAAGLRMVCWVGSKHPQFGFFRYRSCPGTRNWREELPRSEERRVGKECRYGWRGGQQITR